MSKGGTRLNYQTLQRKCFPLSYKKRQERERRQQLIDNELRQKEFEAEVNETEHKLPHKFMVALEYCGWLPEATSYQRRIKSLVQAAHPYCCFNHQIGLPRKKYKDEFGNDVESEPLELYNYEKQIIEDYDKEKYYGLNKVRGSGISEVLPVRHMAYKYAVVNKIKGRKYLLAAGINQAIAISIFARIVELLRPYSKIVYSELPNINRPKVLKFRGGGEGYALPAEPNAARGLENVGDVILDESAFWNLNDDEPVLKAFEPFVTKSGAHIAVFSTPNGQQGFFWTKLFNPEITTKYKLHILDIEAVKNVKLPIIDIAEAERTKLTDPDLYAQEYGNKFILPSASVFGDQFARDNFKAEF